MSSLMFFLSYILSYVYRISVIFRVRSAKVVKITDKDLLKRLGLMMAVVGLIMLIRTLVDPPYVIVGRTADNLKTDLCPTGWWDRFFSICKYKPFCKFMLVCVSESFWPVKLFLILILNLKHQLRVNGMVL